MPRLRFTQEFTLIAGAVVMAAVVWLVCWTTAVQYRFALPPTGGQRLFLAHQEVRLTGSAGEVVQRIASSRHELKQWQQEFAGKATGGLLQIDHGIFSLDEHHRPGSIMRLDAAVAGLLHIQCDHETLYHATAASPATRTIRFDGSLYDVARLPDSALATLLQRARDVEWFRCDPDLFYGTHIALSVASAYAPDAKLRTLNSMQQTATTNGMQERRQIVELADEAEQRLGFRAFWATAATWTVLSAGSLALWAMQWIRLTRRRGEWRLRFLLGAPARRLVGTECLRWVITAAAGCTVGLLFVDSSQSSVQGHVNWAAWIVGIIMLSTGMSVWAYRRAQSDVKRPISTLGLWSSATSTSTLVLWAGLLTLTLAAAAPYAAVQAQLALAARSTPGYSAHDLWSWSVRIPDAALPQLDSLRLAEHLTELPRAHPEIEAVSWMNQGLWSFSGFDGVSGPVHAAFLVGPSIARVLQLEGLDGRDVSISDLRSGALMVQNIPSAHTDMLFRNMPVLGTLEGLRTDVLQAGTTPSLVLQAGAVADRALEVVGRLQPGSRPTVALTADLRRLFPAGAAVAEPESVQAKLALRVAPLESLRVTTTLLMAGGAVLLLVLGGVLLISTTQSQRKEWSIRMTLGSGIWGAARHWLLKYGVVAGFAGVTGLMIGALIVRTASAWVPGFQADPLGALTVAVTILVTVLVLGAAALLRCVTATSLAALMRSE